MGFDRKMDSKVDSKPVWEASPPPFSFTVHFTVHPTTDSTYHTVRPLGRRQSTGTRPPAGPDVQGIPITQERNGDWRGAGAPAFGASHPSITLREKTKCPGMGSCGQPCFGPSVTRVTIPRKRGFSPSPDCSVTKTSGHRSGRRGMRGLAGRCSMPQTVIRGMGSFAGCRRMSATFFIAT